MSYGLAQTKDF